MAPVRAADGSGGTARRAAGRDGRARATAADSGRPGAPSMPVEELINAIEAR
ncbi:hypothetical protein [Actinomadura kijaniata]|uniref:hypothetical protein n=1 Tax=Actinomadura kijaniata TaxID=46161 RepID=UPI00350E4491